MNSRTFRCIAYAMLIACTAVTVASAQTTHIVNLTGLVFDPPDQTITVGDTVQWVWLDGFHNVESGVGGVPDGNFLSGAPIDNPGMTYEVVFDQAFLDANPEPADVYPYYCIVHVGFDMVGTITVDAPGIINVPGDFPTIQAGIDAASDGDEVVVAPGEYFENINLLGKPITVRSTDPTFPPTILATIINGGGLGTVVTCNSGEGPDTVLSGFVITNGSAANGGGMFNDSSSPTVIHCAFSGNTASQQGGGMYNGSSSPTVTNCTFRGNSTDFRGGGMYNVSSSPTVTDCTFSGNSAVNLGAGMYNTGSSPTVTDCTFSGNSASGGGGMNNSNFSSPTVTDCAFSGNSAGGGGGMRNDGSGNPTVTNSVICRNTPDQVSGAYTNGGGNAISDDHCVPIPTITPPCNTGDISPCGGNGIVDLDDILGVIAAFGGTDNCCTR